MTDFTFNIYALIPFLTLLQALVFACLLVIRGKRESNYADYWLAFLLILIGLSDVPYLLGWLQINVLWTDYPFLPWNGLELAIVPTAYLFLRSLLNNNWQFHRSDLKHYWLYIIYFLYHLVIGLQGAAYAKWWWLDVNNRYYIDYVFSITNILLFGFYIKRFLNIYNHYDKWVANHFSDSAPLNINWLRNFIIAYSFYTAVLVGLNILTLLIGAQYDTMWWAYLVNLILIYYLSISGYMRQQMYPLDFTEELLPPKEEKQRKSLSEAEVTVWREKITSYFKQHQPYLNPDLRLVELANALALNPTTLSIIINACFNKNFNDLVNEQRIEAFKAKVAEGALQKYTLTAIAYDCGFNSKTTFNRAFKKYTGVAPGSFSKSQIN